MPKRHAVLAILCSGALSASLSAQVPARIDFGRDVMPIFRQNCVGCHGPDQQMNGLRLDRRSSVFKIGRRRVVPGSSENSFLYHKLVGTEYGPQMPPTGALPPEQVSLIKAWIDQGAEWPDALAHEADLPPPNPKAVAMVEALRSGDRAAFMKSVAEAPALLNARGPEGSTPFMYAVLYCDAPTLEQLLGKGADPNLRNDAGASALMWAATQLEKTRVLLDHGADVNARSEDNRTPLMIAAGHPGGTPIVKLLLDRGADPNPTRNPAQDPSPLSQSALGGNADSMQMLIDHGADYKRAAGPALALALETGCKACVKLLTAKDLDRRAYTFALLRSASFSGDAGTVRLLLDRGADVNAVDPLGRTALMHAAASDSLPLDTVKLLIEHGADINARSQHAQSGDTGQTALEIARAHGETPIVSLLIKSGARPASTRTASAAGAAPRLLPAAGSQSANEVQSAVERSLPLLQRTDASFVAKSGCVSCHNNSLTAMAVSAARGSRFTVDEPIAARQVKANEAFLEQHRDSLHQGYFAVQASGVDAFGDTIGPGILGYILVGLAAEHHQPDLNTDAVALYLKSRQMPDGRWAASVDSSRPPLCSDYIGQTALSMRALQLYTPNVDRADFEKSIALAAAWLAKAEPVTNEDRIWRLLGLAWAARDKDATRSALSELAGLQRSDGGWSDLAPMESTAFATGAALVALNTAGLPVSDAAYQRGLRYLLNTQLPDGSWHVKTRALALQPYFDNGFPHGVDQWISAAATNWATMALALAAQNRTPGSTPVARLTPRSDR